MCGPRRHGWGKGWVGKGDSRPRSRRGGGEWEKTDFSAFKASQNACRWDVCCKLMNIWMGHAKFKWTSSVFCLCYNCLIWFGLYCLLFVVYPCMLGEWRFSNRLLRAFHYSHFSATFHCHLCPRVYASQVSQQLTAGHYRPVPCRSHFVWSLRQVSVIFVTFRFAALANSLRI